MRRVICGYHQDDEGHWVAELTCGHTQHVRHEPPLTSREWVLTAEGRRAHLGTFLNCIVCDELQASTEWSAGQLRAEVERSFPAEEVDRAMELLNSYGNTKWQREPPRVRRVIVQTSKGSLEQLEKLVSVAKHDYRDVLMGDRGL